MTNELVCRSYLHQSLHYLIEFIESVFDMFYVSCCQDVFRNFAQKSTKYIMSLLSYRMLIKPSTNGHCVVMHSFISSNSWQRTVDGFYILLKFLHYIWHPSTLLSLFGIECKIIAIEQFCDKLHQIEWLFRRQSGCDSLLLSVIRCFFRIFDFW